MPIAYVPINMHEKLSWFSLLDIILFKISIFLTHSTAFFYWSVNSPFNNYANYFRYFLYFSSCPCFSYFGFRTIIFSTSNVPAKYENFIFRVLTLIQWQNFENDENKLWDFDPILQNTKKSKRWKHQSFSLK